MRHDAALSTFRTHPIEASPPGFKYTDKCRRYRLTSRSLSSATAGALGGLPEWVDMYRKPWVKPEHEHPMKTALTRA
jgi:hypothetical protein